VAAKLNALRNREERESRRRSACAWMARALVSPGTAEPPPDLAELARRLETYLWQPSQRGGEVEEWLRDVAADLDPADTAYRVLRGAGRLPQDADRFLATAGIREEFPPRALEACESLAPFAPEASREDFTSLLTFSIDDPGTAEVDDALSVEAVPDGGARIGIHIADVAAFVDVGGVLDLEAFRRGTSIYLPSRTVTMLPRRLACGLASLERGELRPSLSFVADIDAGGAVRGVRIARGMVRVWERLDYRAVDALLRERRSDPLAVALARLDFLSASLLAGRRARGALVLRRPELRVRARPGEPLEVEVLDAESAGRRIVTELMILANRAAAEWARSFGIAIIYRAQDPPREPIVVPEVYDPVALDEVFRRLSRSAFSTHPRPHGGLGLECYTQTTSPIRRYADLVIQRQLAAHLDGRPLPYGVEELLRVLAASQDAEVEARRVEERATRFHLLEHLQATRCADELEGVLVRRQGSSGIVETTDLYVRGTLLGAGGFSPGHRLRLRIERIDPERDVLVFRAVG
jgi:exoribonuclease-2